jgi:hypothetical protein
MVGKNARMNTGSIITVCIDWAFFETGSPRRDNVIFQLQGEKQSGENMK